MPQKMNRAVPGALVLMEQVPSLSGGWQRIMGHNYRVILAVVPGSRTPKPSSVSEAVVE